MDSERWKHTRGLKRLLHDGVRLGSSFVEKHHRRAASKPFVVLEAIEPLATPARAVRQVHGSMLTLTYGSIRAVNSTIEVVGDWIVDELAAGHGAADASETTRAADASSH